jgi:hypothetical protein
MFLQRPSGNVLVAAAAHIVYKPGKLLLTKLLFVFACRTSPAAAASAAAAAAGAAQMARCQQAWSNAQRL